MNTKKIDLVERERKNKDTLKHACCSIIQLKTTKYVNKHVGSLWVGEIKG